MLIRMTRRCSLSSCSWIIFSGTSALYNPVASYGLGCFPVCIFPWDACKMTRLFLPPALSSRFLCSSPENTELVGLSTLRTPLSPSRVSQLVRRYWLSSPKMLFPSHMTLQTGSVGYGYRIQWRLGVLWLFVSHPWFVSPVIFWFSCSTGFMAVRVQSESQPEDKVCRLFITPDWLPVWTSAPAQFQWSAGLGTLESSLPC